MLPPLFAMFDMRGPLLAAAVVFAIGLLLLRLLSRRDVPSRSHIWLPLVALGAGPVVGLGWWALDVFVLSPESYVTPSEYFASLPGTLLIGTFVGVITALAIAIVYRLRSPKGN